METPQAITGRAVHRWDGMHCTFTMERPARGVVVLRIAGHDVGEFGDAPLRALEGHLSADGTIMLFVDARDTEGASIDVSGAWARWLAAHRARCARIAMLPGSRFIAITARFVRSFAGLDAVMRLYSDAAAFDRDLSDAVAKANAAPAH